MLPSGRPDGRVEGMKPQVYNRVNRRFNPCDEWDAGATTRLLRTAVDFCPLRRPLAMRAHGDVIVAAHDDDPAAALFFDGVRLTGCCAFNPDVFFYQP